MARIILLPTTLSLLLPLALVLATGSAEDGFVRTIDHSLTGLKKEKLSHFRFYWHELFKGPNKTAVQIIKPLNSFSDQFFFGSISVIDSPMTEGPELSSKVLGRVQGFHGRASQQDTDGLIMAMNLYFVQGKYNGSSITILGRNPFLQKVREMPVIGGTGLFRLARGYALLKAYKVDPEKSIAVVEYNVYVLHYE